MESCLLIMCILMGVLMGLGVGYPLGRNGAFNELIENGDIEKFIDEDGDVAVRAKCGDSHSGCSSSADLP